MANLLRKIADPQKDVSKINKNFDDISLDLADLSGTFSSTGSVRFTLVSNSSNTIEVNVIDSLNLYELNKIPIIPRVSIFIDWDQDYTFSYPLGSNLDSTILMGISVEVFQSQIVLNPVTNEKTTQMIKVKNTTPDSHIIFFYIDNFYVPAPQLGVSKRPTS